MRHFKLYLLGAALTALALLASGCGQGGGSVSALGAGSGSAASSQGAGSASSQVASSSEMAGVTDVVEEGMVPISPSQLRDGTYAVTVDSSSSMFQVVDCQLTVDGDTMTAVMTMSGTGYRCLYPGAGEEAVQAPEEDYISYTENADGSHSFTFPVEALDQGLPCAAFSDRKEKWYDRTILFRSDSLPLEAFQEGSVVTADSLGLADGVYQVDVTLTGGSGRASVASPARLTVEGGQAQVLLIWSSSNYDYMKVDGVRYDVTIAEDRSTFTIPVSCFDRAMAVVADTVAMSTPHEVEYALWFDSASLVPAEG